MILKKTFYWSCAKGSSQSRIQWKGEEKNIDFSLWGNLEQFFFSLFWPLCNKLFRLSKIPMNWSEFFVSWVWQKCQELCTFSCNIFIYQSLIIHFYIRFFKLFLTGSLAPKSKKYFSLQMCYIITLILRRVWSDDFDDLST